MVLQVDADFATSLRELSETVAANIRNQLFNTRTNDHFITQVNECVLVMLENWFFNAPGIRILSNQVCRNMPTFVFIFSDLYISLPLARHVAEPRRQYQRFCGL